MGLPQIVEQKLREFEAAQTCDPPSPSKKRKLNIPPAVQRSQHSNSELWGWTLTAEAISSCFVKDVFNMEEDATKGVDFFWLGRVPCRSVRIVGMVVGVQVAEQRTFYTVDDGTSVIECIFRHPLSPSSLRESLPAACVAAAPPLAAEVGDSVCIVGKVIKWFESRRINIDKIDRCVSVNEEPEHWRTVLSLHKTFYYRSGQFVIPNALLANSAEDRGEDPKLYQVHQLSVPSSPSASSCAASSPAKSVKKNQSPTKSLPKLRHPSRLHSRDLTANTFRIYVKHYMDNAPPSPMAFMQSCDEDSDSELASYSVVNIPTTPTKLKYTSSHRPQVFGRHEENSQTPRPSKAAQTADRTPRPSRNCVLSAQGFTISYLRRIPELADMAYRVVKAEARRRRKQLQDEKAQGRTTAEDESFSSETIAPKMKRLFRWAVVKLYEEGSIILWDGAARPCATAGGEIGILWKANSSVASTSVDSSVFSIRSTSSRSRQDIDIGELSDPPPDEESYISLTAAYLAPFVENAIVALTARKVGDRSASVSPAPFLSKLRSVPAPVGPTKADITTYLRRTDERWARVGEWVVGDALEVLRADERAWCIGKERWEICL